MRRSRRARSSPGRWAARRLTGALMLTVSLLGREVDALASVYSFGILLAFMRVFASVIALRVREPSLPRVVRMEGAPLRQQRRPVLALLGLAMSWALWVLDLGTHRAGRILPPAWLACGVCCSWSCAACRASPCWSASTRSRRRRPRSSTSLRDDRRAAQSAGRSRRRCSRSPASSPRSRKASGCSRVNVVEVPLSLRWMRRSPGRTMRHGPAPADRSFSRDYGVPVSSCPRAAVPSAARSRASPASRTPA